MKARPEPAPSDGTPRAPNRGGATGPDEIAAGEVLQRIAALLAQGRAHGLRDISVEASLQQLLEQARAGQAANERLAAVVRSSDDAIITKDLNGVITSWNPAAERIFGYTEGEIVGRSILTLIPPERVDEETTILSRLRRGEHIQHYETVRRRKDGSLVDVALTVSPMRSETGEIIGASKIARDITQRRRAEAQQRSLFELVARINSAAELSDLYDAALDAILRCQEADRAAILLYDANGVMRFVAARGLSDDYRRAVDGHSPWKHDERNASPICIEDVSTGGLPEELRFVLEREGIHSLAFVPLQLEGRLLGKFMVYRNRPQPFPAHELQSVITIASQVAFAIERRKSSEALESLVRERTASLQKAIEQMEEFSYTVSHDIRAPIRAMRGYADVLSADYGAQLDDSGRELLARIQRNGARMDRLIQDLLLYTRVARREVKLEPVALETLVRDVIEDSPEMAPDRALIEVVGPLPVVLGHEPSLTQVVSNLLANAVKFVARGTKPHIRIGCDHLPDAVRLWFQDNGVGIPPEYHRRVFGMFERFHPAGDFEGTGIGLAIVRKAVERMGGTVGVVSDGRSGSRFWVQLPMPPSAASATA